MTRQSAYLPKLSTSECPGNSIFNIFVSFFKIYKMLFIPIKVKVLGGGGGGGGAES